ncbi:MAG: cytochrome c3 family protein [bacterium]|nr:cytochrome c3 family protein [bacterium]
MKKLLIFCLAVLLTGTVFGVITGSEHDFSTEGWNSTGEICITCHTPHNAMAVTNGPIWNHEVTTATFTMYGTTLAGTTPDATPSGMSKLCLSCHDGTVGLEAFGGVTTNNNLISGSELVGTDLSNDHPISITYGGTANGLFAGTAASGVSGGSTIDADMLYSNKVECSSCHDVHNKYNISKLLKKSNAASALCLTCHDK